MNDPKNILQQLNVEMASLVTQARQRLVQVTDGYQSVGAGTVWHPAGLIVTNAHVAHTRRLQIVLQDGQTFPARILARDNRYDLAALAVDAHDLPSMKLGDSKKLVAGQWVLALGHPWGETGATTAGIVIGQETSADERQWLTVDLRLRPGHSGGPLIDSKGQLVGINTMMNGPEVGVAIPVNVAKHFLHQYLTA